MTLGGSRTLCFSWLYHIFNLFGVWIRFRAYFLVAVKSIVALFFCVSFLISAVSLSAFTILGIHTNRKDSDSFGFLSTAISSCG